MQRELWAALNGFIRENGGWVTSQPGIATITFESTDDELAELLRRRGYDVFPAGTAERLLPSVISEHRGTKTFTTQSVSPGVVNVFQFDLPSVDNRLP
jgi:hypothetical protein